MIFGPAVRWSIDLNSRDLPEIRLHSIPDPDRDILGRRVLESLDLVQASVIQRADDAGEAFFNVEAGYDA